MYCIMEPANLDKDYLPEPPTPTNNACPLGYDIILHIFNTCFNASSKRTKPI